jgi:hypothetical protein
MPRATPAHDPTQFARHPVSKKKSGDFSPLLILATPEKHSQISKSMRVSKEKGGDYSPPKLDAPAKQS